MNTTNNKLHDLLDERRNLKKKKKDADELVKIHVKKTVKYIWAVHNAEYRQKYELITNQIAVETKKGVGKAIKNVKHGKKKLPTAPIRG